MTQDILHSEFNRQLNNLLEKDYPKAAGISNEKFTELVMPLEKKLTLSAIQFETDFDNGTLPFVIIVSNKLVPTEFAMTHTERDNKPGIVKLYPHEPKDFNQIREATIPEQRVYVITNVDRGKDTINLPPNEAYKLLLRENRLPLTIDEGVAIITHFPEFLMKNNCFSLLASRHEGDKRVPAIWINAEKQPNLGWCWEGNPHTWLGSASCSNRVY